MKTRNNAGLADAISGQLRRHLFLSMNAKWMACQKKKEMFTLLLSNCFAEPRRDQNVISRKHGMLGGEVSRRPQIQKGDNEKKKKKFSGRTLEVAHHRAYVHDLYCLCVVIRIKGQFCTAYSCVEHPITTFAFAHASTFSCY